jgi:hypothetical protein
MIASMMMRATQLGQVSLGLNPLQTKQRTKSAKSFGNDLFIPAFNILIGLFG